MDEMGRKRIKLKDQNTIRWAGLLPSVAGSRGVQLSGAARGAGWQRTRGCCCRKGLVVRAHWRGVGGARQASAARLVLLRQA